MVHTPTQRYTHTHTPTPAYPFSQGLAFPQSTNTHLSRPFCLPSTQTSSSVRWGEDFHNCDACYNTEHDTIWSYLHIPFIVRLWKIPLFGLWIKGKEECHLVGVSVMTTTTSDLHGFPSTSENRSAMYTHLHVMYHQLGATDDAPLQFFYFGESSCGLLFSWMTNIL